MSYIELINRFWLAHEENCFSTCEIALYFYLLKVNNICNWVEFFKRNNSKIMADLGIKDRRTLENARNKLKQAGLIDYQKKNTNPNVYYSITSAFNAQVDVQVPAQVDAQVDAQVPAQVLYTKDRYRQDKTTNIPPIVPQPDQTLPFKEDKKKKSGRAKKEFVPPTLEDVLDFFSGSLLPDWENQGRLFFSHYNSQGWRKGTGVQVTAWDSLANKWILDEKIKRDGSNKDEPNGKDRKRCVIRSVSFG